MKRTLCIILLLAGSAAATDVRADIYRLDGDDETITFTDAPVDRRFQLVIKEQPQKKVPPARERTAGSGKAPPADKTAADPTFALNEKYLPIQGRITSTTGLRSDPFDGKLKHHNGLDIAAPAGTPVKPVAPGKVVFSGWKGGYGNTVIIDHQDGMTTVYAHHASNCVSEGSPVTCDTVIAHSGSTGRSTGPHLHFEAWHNGVNISTEFVPGSKAAPRSGRLAAAPINRYLQDDGTIVFTNLR